MTEARRVEIRERLKRIDGSSYASQKNYPVPLMLEVVSASDLFFLVFTKMSLITALIPPMQNGIETFPNRA